MSFVTVDEVKIALVTGDIDDARIQQAIDSAEDEALQFLNVTGTTLEDAITNVTDTGSKKSIRKAVILLASAEIDPVKYSDLEVIRKAAERVLWPYREGLGV